jgi:hypothetical protein
MTANSIKPSAVQAQDRPTVHYRQQTALLFASLPANTWTLCWTVTATKQTDADGYGPAYLLNGLTNAGYWYQVGISYNYGATQGFQFAYEWWDNHGHSLQVSSDDPVPFSETVNDGDSIALSLYFQAGNIVMLAIDGNTQGVAEIQASAFTATQFVATPTSTGDANGYFTGLMTEWLAAQALTAQERMVLYYNWNPGFQLTSAWAFMQEYEDNGNYVYPQRSQLLTYTNPTVGLTWTYGNAMTTSTATVFVTGTYTPPTVQTVGVTTNPNNPNPTASSITVNPGMTVYVVCAGASSNGIPPYTYQWYCNGAAISGATSLSFTFNTILPDTYNFYLEVTDSNLVGEVSNTVTVTVNAILTVAVPSAPTGGATVLVDGVPYTAYSTLPVTLSVPPGSVHTIQPIGWTVDMGTYEYCYVFTSWSDGSTAYPRTVTMTSSLSLTAYFTRVKVVLQ